MSSVSESQAAKEQVSNTSTLSIAWTACSRSCESPIPPDGMTNKYSQQGWWQNKILDTIWNRWIMRQILGIQNQAKIFCYEIRCELMGGEVQPSSAACASGLYLLLSGWDWRRAANRSYLFLCSHMHWSGPFVHECLRFVFSTLLGTKTSCFLCSLFHVNLIWCCRTLSSKDLGQFTASIYQAHSTLKIGELRLTWL